MVDLAEILSDELVEVQMIRKSGYGNEVSMRGFGHLTLFFCLIAVFSAIGQLRTHYSLRVG